MPGSKTRPGLFGDTPVMFVGPKVLPGRVGLSLEGSVYAITWSMCARAGLDLDCGVPAVFRQVHRNPDVLIFDRAGGRILKSSVIE